MKLAKSLGALLLAVALLAGFCLPGALPLRAAAASDELLLWGFENDEMQLGTNLFPRGTGVDPAFSTEQFTQGAGALKKPLIQQGVYPNMFRLNRSAPADLSEYKAIHIDLYISDIGVWNAYWKNYTVLQFHEQQLVQGDNRTKAASLSVALSAYDLAQGWNTLEIDVSTVPMTALQAIALSNNDPNHSGSFSTDVYASNNSNYNPFTDDAKMNLYVDNCVAVKTPDELVIGSCDNGTGESIGVTGVPFSPAYQTAVATKSQGKSSLYYQLGGHWNSAANARGPWPNHLRVTLPQAVDLSEYNTLRFDIYISDIETYRTYWADIMAFRLFDRGLANQVASKYWCMMPGDLKQGWNTVTFDISAAADKGELTAINIINLQPAISAPSGSVTDANSHNAASCFIENGTLPDYTYGDAATVVTYVDNFRVSKERTTYFNFRQTDRTDKKLEFPNGYGTFASTSLRYDAQASDYSTLHMTFTGNGGGWANTTGYVTQRPFALQNGQVLDVDVYLSEESAANWNDKWVTSDARPIFRFYNTSAGEGKNYTQSDAIAWLPKDQLKAGWNTYQITIHTEHLGDSAQAVGRGSLDAIDELTFCPAREGALYWSYFTDADGNCRPTTVPADAKPVEFVIDNIRPHEEARATGSSSWRPLNGQKDAYVCFAPTRLSNTLKLNYAEDAVRQLRLERSFAVFSKDGGVLKGQVAVGTGAQLDVYNEYGDPLAEKQTVVLLGDLNGDATITLVDVKSARGAILGTSPLSGAAEQAADFNRSEAVDILDLVQINLRSAAINP